MSEKEFTKLCELDDIAAQSGGYVDYTPSQTELSSIHYDYRSIIKYC